MTLPLVPRKVAGPLRIMRRQAQPKAVFVARLTVTAVAAYLISRYVPMTGSPPTLAPLTALLVLQVTLYRTVRSAIQRIGSVVGGVLIAGLLASVTGFTWWSLGLVIAAALVLGLLLRLGEHVLEVPISAMLILSLPTDYNAADRVVETLVGAGTGLLAGLVLSPVRVQPAEEAVEDLSRRMAELLDRMAGGLRDERAPEEAAGWLRRSRELGREIGRVHRALEDAEDSIRMNPRATRLMHAGTVLRTGLESLEHLQVCLRGLARSVADATRGRSRPPYGRASQGIADALGDLAGAVRAYGRLVRSEVGGDPGEAEGELRRCLSSARRHRDRIAETLLRSPADDPADWPLRGELIVHLDRLIDRLGAERRVMERKGRPGRFARRLVRPVERRPGGRSARRRRGAARSRRTTFRADFSANPQRDRIRA